MAWQVERLVVTAVDQQVAEGRPRDIVEATEPFRLVSEYFIGKVRLPTHTVRTRMEQTGRRHQRTVVTRYHK